MSRVQVRCRCGATLRLAANTPAARCPRCLEIVEAPQQPPRRSRKSWFKMLGRMTLLLFIGTLFLVSSYGIEHPAVQIPEAEYNPIAPAPLGLSTTPTEREISRLCGRWARDSTPRQKTALSWNRGWDGPLGTAATKAGLTFEWRCHVKGFSPAQGFLCSARPDGPTRYRLHPLALAGRHLRGEEVIAAGDLLLLREVRRALAEQDGAVITVGKGCTIDLVLDDDHYVKIIPAQP